MDVNYILPTKLIPTNNEIAIVFDSHIDINDINESGVNMILVNDVPCLRIGSLLLVPLEYFNLKASEEMVIMLVGGDTGYIVPSDYCQITLDRKKVAKLEVWLEMCNNKTIDPHGAAI